MQKHVIYDKFFRVLGDEPSEIVQVGDSSGFYGVIPSEVTFAAKGKTYLNLSCCGDTGWNGYFYEAQAALERKHRPQTLLLHITPFWAPASAAFYGDNQLAVLIRDYIAQDAWWHKIRPPSADYRLRITNLIYNGVWLDDFAYDTHADQPNYPKVRAWREQFRQARGWSPLPWAIDDALLTAPSPLPCSIENAYSEEIWMGLWRRDSLYRYLERFALLTKAHDARFVFVTNPVPCVVQNDETGADVSRQLARFRLDYPNVAIPFAFLRQWPQHEFRDRWHLNIAGAVKHSRLIGDALRTLQ
jgi:hypothetical protein